MTLLETVSSPRGVRELPAAELPRLAEEIRGFLVEHVSRSGGHLGPNLGVVELTIAIHRVFDSPRDIVLFDTGHQAYVHKLLTGRAADFGSLRRSGGLSGYPSAAESPHDLVENSHASTALSYADGVAKALRLRGSQRRVVVVVGDGALTGGMAWEALNNLAETTHPVVVVLNDNGRSYAPTAGGLGAHLAELRAGRGVSVFERLGLGYAGPVDGHDVVELERAFAAAARARGPVVVHCLTRKGNGYAAAESDLVDHLHSVPAAGQSAGPTWTDVFGDEVVAIGAERPDVVCVTAAMGGPAGLGRFAARFPDRVFDVGIAEQHAVTAAAGMAMAGLHPLVAVFSTFLGRAFDQVLLDVALHRLPVTFVVDHAGATDADGPSHHGMWDSALLPLVPGLRVAAPRDGARLREALRQAVGVADGPTAVRFPKAPLPEDIPHVRRVGGIDLLWTREEADVLVVAAGAVADDCVRAARDLDRRGVPTTVVDPRWIAPLDPVLVDWAAQHRHVLVVEDGVECGGMGDRLGSALPRGGVRSLALPRRFLPQGSREEVLRGSGLDAAGIAEAVTALLAPG